MTKHRRQTRQSKVNYSQHTQEVDYTLSKKIQTTKLIKPKNKHQCEYIDSINRNVLTFVLGPSGVSKSLLALSEACKLVNSESSPIEKIYYLRTNVGISHEQGLGFVPGTIQEKTLMLAYPVLDNLIEFMTEGSAKYLIESGKIEVLPIAMVRGRSFKNAFIIYDEAQTSSTHQLRTVLTRISEGSKMVIAGDYEQCDFQDTSLSGLKSAVNKLRDIKDVGVVEFTSRDIVRHPIISHILERL